MKAAIIYKAGGPENIVLEVKTIPIPPQGWVLIKVKAFGLNRSELMTRKGYSPNVTFPRVLGIECVGQVVNDPSGELQPDQKVAAFMGGMGRDFDGSYQQYAVLPKNLLYVFESTLSWKELGAIPEMFQTAYGSLHLALKIKQDELLLIRGGTSSIGMLAAQLARKAGLKVIATTRNPAHEPLLLSNGADQVLIENGQLEAKVKTISLAGADKVLELIGTSTLKDSLACAAPGGIVCMTGMLAEQWSITDFAPMDYIPATVSLTIYDSGQVRVDQQSFQEFINDVQFGKIQLTIGRSFQFEDIVFAHQLMDDNLAGGKIVILT